MCELQNQKLVCYLFVYHLFLGSTKNSVASHTAQANDSQTNIKVRTFVPNVRTAILLCYTVNCRCGNKTVFMYHGKFIFVYKMHYGKKIMGSSGIFFFYSARHTVKLYPFRFIYFFTDFGCVKRKSIDNS